MHNLHRRIILRLIAGFVVLSIMIGGVVVYLDLEAVDDRVVRLGEDAAAGFLRDNHDVLASSDAGMHSDRLALAVQKLVDAGHFAIVEIYNARQSPLIERSKQGYHDVETALDRSPHRFPAIGASYYTKHLVHGALYLQMISPIIAADGKVVAYFEGVYEVDAAAMADIKAGVLHSLLVAVIAILFTSVLLYPVILSLNRSLFLHAERLLRANLEMLEVLGSAIAKRDSDTDTHNYRVTWYAVRLAEAIGLDRATMQRLIKGAFLHDVGKIGISDSILLKPGKLTPEEFRVMQQHVALGLEIISQSEWLAEADDVVRYHHEKFDGKGYLNGLAGEAIPLVARIFAIVDVFDALTSKRPYKDPMPLAQAISILDEGSGSHFDPDLLTRFRAMAPDLLEEGNGLGHDGMRAALHVLTQRYFFA
ncbi:MAG: HD domain-containing phosphohydrolase [Ferrovibrio sp.]